MTTISKNQLIGREIRARRKGGSIVHVMELTEDGHAPSSGALCGDKPRHDRYSSMNLQLISRGELAVLNKRFGGIPVDLKPTARAVVTLIIKSKELSKNPLSDSDGRDQE